MFASITDRAMRASHMDDGQWSRAGILNKLDKLHVDSMMYYGGRVDVELVGLLMELVG